MSEPVRPSATEPYRAAFETVRPDLRGLPEQRRAAFARFAELGFPGPREEAWKYTSLRRLESRRFAPSLRDAAAAASVVLPESLGAARVVLVNGHLRADLSTLAALPTGVRLTAPGATQDEPGVSAAVLGWTEGGGTERFAALNAAMCPDPLLVEAGPGADGQTVLHVIAVAIGASPSMSFPRLVLRVASGARLRVVLQHVGDDAVEHFVSSCVDAAVADGGELHLYRLQASGSKTFHIERCDGTVGAGGRLHLRDAQLGGSLGRVDLNVALAGKASEAELTGLYLADGSRHLDTHVRIDHRAVDTRSLQDFRGIAANRGRAVFNGKTVVHEGAQKSNARQSSRNLLLTPGAEIDTKPELEIYADDVQCSHGATTGQLDPAALFYLRSRGLSESEARSALTRAFAGAVLSRIDHAALAARVHDELDQRLTRLLEQPA